MYIHTWMETESFQSTHASSSKWCVSENKNYMTFYLFIYLFIYFFGGRGQQSLVALHFFWLFFSCPPPFNQVTGTGMTRQLPPPPPGVKFRPWDRSVIKTGLWSFRRCALVADLSGDTFGAVQARKNLLMREWVWNGKKNREWWIYM
jgi:hypothetical protein